MSIDGCLGYAPGVCWGSLRVSEFSVVAEILETGPLDSNLGAGTGLVRPTPPFFPNVPP